MRKVVADDADGTRLDRFLGLLAPVGSRTRAERLVAAGNVRVNGHPAPTKSLRLRTGDEVTIDDEALVEAPLVEGDLELDLPILFDDEHLIIIDKPAGLMVHPAPGRREPALTDLLGAGGVELAAAADDAQGPRPGVVHRLDRDTSGAIVLARTPAALRAMQDLIRERLVRREYVALVHGTPPSRAGRIEAAIGRHWRDPTRQSIDTDRPRDAITHFVVDELVGGMSLLRVRLETGRTHQIRVHMQAIGHPVVGDPTYGGPGPRLGLDRQFLHAGRLAFTHPITGVDVDVRSPLPPDLHAALLAAREAQGGT